MSAEKIINDWKKNIFKPVYWLEGEEDFYIDKVMDYAEHHILNESEAGLTVSNSTIANNTVSDGLFNWGGGIYGSGELNYVTVAHNSAGSGSTSAFQAGGIYS